MNTTFTWPTTPDETTELSQADRDALLSNWNQAKLALDQWKEREMGLRKQIDELLFDPDVESGTQNLQLGNGYKLKCVRKVNHRIDNKEFPAVRDQLAPDVAERIARMKYDLSLSEFKRLREKADGGDVFVQEQLRMLESVITTTQASPSLSLVEPKAKK